MCGRFSLFADDGELVSLFDVDLLDGEHSPSWNVAPSHQVRVVLDRIVSEPIASAGQTPSSKMPAGPGNASTGLISNSSNRTNVSGSNPNFSAALSGPEAPPNVVSMDAARQRLQPQPQPQPETHPHSHPQQRQSHQQSQAQLQAHPGNHSSHESQPHSATARIRQRQMRLVEWGLVPTWAKPPFHPMINARAETLVEKPSFRWAASKRRCLVPANGYFEWQQAASGSASSPKQPWFLSAGPDDPVLAFAGIIEMRKNLEGQWWPTCAIVTRSAPDALGQIHDRTPVIVPSDLWDAWLDPALTDADGIRGLLDAIPLPALRPRQVSRVVGSVKNNGPDLIRPIA